MKQRYQGAFILLCFIAWIVWRVLKRNKTPGSGGGTGIGFIDKLYMRNREPTEGTWNGPTLFMAKETPPQYEKGEYGAVPSGMGFYGPAKMNSTGANGAIGSVASGSERGTVRQPLRGNPVTNVLADMPQAENEGTRANGNVYPTSGSYAAQPYYDESELSRPPPDMFRPPKRTATRASEISSISSGFGDGDLFVAPSFETSQPTSEKTSEAPPGVAQGSRDSWMSREGAKRETIYTETSEDRPARFRSITSWVNQQAGRAKRASSRARERGEVPVMPAIPGEISATQQTTYR